MDNWMERATNGISRRMLVTARDKLERLDFLLDNNQLNCLKSALRQVK